MYSIRGDQKKGGRKKNPYRSEGSGKGIAANDISKPAPVYRDSDFGDDADARTMVGKGGKHAEKWNRMLRLFRG